MTDSCAAVVVLGGGIQGCCLALELARRGIQVTILEQDGLLLNRASLRNEGKIHLGLIYANEPDMATACLQLRGALGFAALVERWTGQSPSSLGLSTPFHYLVANESILDPEKLQLHYERLGSFYLELHSVAPNLEYLGTRPDRLFRVLSPSALAQYQKSGQVRAGFATAEMAISPDSLAHFIRAAVCDNHRIRAQYHCRVESISGGDGNLTIEYTDGSGRPLRLSAEQVANASWDGRLAIDRSFGMSIGKGWLYRLKYRVITTLPQAMAKAPSATLVIGRFGDVVIRPDSTAYLSWYPSAIRGWSSDLSPPASWQDSCMGLTDAHLCDQLAAEFAHGIMSWYPGLEKQQILQVDAGVIFAHGATDVNDPGSGLHSRSAFGVTSRGGYHSVNPGKLTTAPMVAVAAADRISGRSPADFGDLEVILRRDSDA